MNIPKAYIGGFQKAIKLPRMLFIMYFANLFTALILALTFKGMLSESFGQSGILSTLLEDFDFTTFSNLMFDHGDAIKAVIGGIKWLLIAYFLLSVFITGGIIHTLNINKFSTSTFFGGSAYNFFRLLGLNALMVAVQIVFLLLVYIPLGIILKSVAENMTSEVTLYYIGISGFVFHLLLFLFISMIGDYAKLYMVLNDSFNVFKGFWKGLKYVFGHFIKTYVLYLILLFLPAVIMYLYLYLERDIKMATGVGILIVFLMQQAFMLLRVFLRTWILSSEFLIFNDDFVKPMDKKEIVFSVVNTMTNTEKEIIEEPIKKADKQPVAEIPVKTDTVIKEEPKTEYAIDFSKTFTTNHEDETTSERIITEEEMLKKVNEEESVISEEKIETTINKSEEIIENKSDIVPENVVTSNVETNVIEENIVTVSDETGTSIENIVTASDETGTVEENSVNEENFVTAGDETDVVDENNETVINEAGTNPDEENIITAGNETDTNEENTETSNEESTFDENEFVVNNADIVQQNVINTEDESGENVQGEINKDSKKDMIEFE